MSLIQNVLDLFLELLLFLWAKDDVEIGFLEGWDYLGEFIGVRQLIQLGLNFSYNMCRHFILYTEIPRFSRLHINLPQINCLWVNKYLHQVLPTQRTPNIPLHRIALCRRRKLLILLPQTIHLLDLLSQKRRICMCIRYVATNRS